MTLAGLAKAVAGAVTLKPWLVPACAIALAALVGFSGWAGMRFERVSWQAKELRAAAKNRATERSGAAIILDVERRAIAADKKRQERADATILELRAELDARPAKCPVSRRAVRVLDGRSVPADSRSRTDARSPRAQVEADAGSRPVECGTVVEHCTWNRVNVCDAAADQADQLRDTWHRLQQKYKPALMDIYDQATAAEETFRERALRFQAARAPRGVSASACLDCSEPIPEERRRAVAGCTRCFDCQELKERTAR